MFKELFIYQNIILKIAVNSRKQVFLYPGCQSGSYIA